MSIDYIYKYRSCSEKDLENTLNIIQNNELYFSKPEDFNDPYDSQLMIDMEAPDEDYERIILERMKLDPRFRNVKFSEEELRELLKEEIKDLKENGAQTFADLSAKKIGVCCFSCKNNNLVMWAHYANFHDGICLQFSFNGGFFSKAFEVIYSSHYPEINFFSSQIKRINGLFLTKSSHWKEEKEYRIVIDRFGVRKFPEVELTGIILGCKLNKKVKLRVQKILKNKTNRVDLFQANIRHDLFGLDILKI